MISEEAQSAWDLLRTYARVADEKWDEMHSVTGWATESTVQEAYRSAVRYVHPDTGGSTEAFTNVKTARDTLLDWLTAKKKEEDKPCQQCDGKGFVLSHRAWRSLRVVCPFCKGRGN